MAERHDAPYIKAVAKQYGNTKARKLQQLPFFLVSESFVAENEELLKTIYEGSISSDPDFINSLPFTEFTVVIQAAACHKYAHVNINMEDGNPCWEIGLPLSPKHYPNTFEHEAKTKKLNGVLFYHSIQWVKDSEGKGYDRLSTIWVEDAPCEAKRKDKNALVKMLDSGHTVLKRSLDKEEKTGERGAIGYYTNTILLLTAFFTYAQTAHRVKMKSDRVPRDNARTALRKPWLNADLITYTYINDREEHEQRSSSTAVGTGRKVRGHNRRGHFRTLKDARFKKHPMYGKPVRIRPTWVGPRDWVKNGTVYTVD